MSARNPIYDTPTPAEIAAREKRERERIERVTRPGPVETAISNALSAFGEWTTSSRGGETDQQGIARRARERAQVAKPPVIATKSPGAATPTAEERAFQTARNTRVDLLTPDQKRLIRQGRPDAAKTPAVAAKPPAAAVAPTKQEVAKPPADVAAPATVKPATAPAAAAPPPKQEVTKGTGELSSAGTGEAKKELLPIPKAVVAKAVNTNTELTNADGTLKASTTDSAFSLGKRTKGAFNIGRFRAEVSSADSVLPTHSFLVVFAPMPWAIQRYPQAGNLDSILTMRCDNVVLPSINLLQEQNIRRYGFGPVENVAYGVNVGDFTLQFIVDKKAHVIGFFEAWLNRIVNRTSYGGADMNTTTDGRTPYEVAYKDTYACSSVNVFMYDRSQNNVLEYNIYDVFPTGIQSMNMSWSEENTLMKLNVTFSFTDLRIQQSAEKNKSGVGFGSSVDFQNALLTGPKMTDAQMRALSQGGFLVRDGKGGIGFDATPGTVKVSGKYGSELGSITPIQSSTAVPQTISDSSVPKNYSALGVEINIAP